jgi:hypothetical protein
MASPAEQVAAAFEQAQAYAASAQSNLTGFTSALNGAIYAAPSVSLTAAIPTPPELPAMPTLPDFGEIAYTLPTEPSLEPLADLPDLVVDEFNEVAPDLDYPNRPTLSYGAAPVIPVVGTVSMPDAPVMDAITAPEYLELSVITMAELDMHDDYLAKLQEIPTLELLTPTPYSYTRGPAYASALLESLKATLKARMAGGTGLNPAIEQAIWGRARDRETKIALANEAEISRNSTAFGFALPSGALAAQLRDAQQTYYGKLSGLSRDVAIKQAEMEVENLKQAISQGMELEVKLMDYATRMEQLAFDAAKVAAETAIQAYNAQIDRFKALLSAYQMYAAAYDTLIKGELAKVDVFKAQLQGEQVKVEMNKTMTDQLKIFTDAQMLKIKTYESQVSAANALVTLEQVKISAAGEQIKAYGAKINAETSKVEAYKAGIQAESGKVEIYKIKADAFSTIQGVKAEHARAQIARYSAIAQTRSAEWDGYRAKAEVEKSSVQAQAMQNSARLDGYKAAAAASESEANAQSRQWETSIKAYEAGQSLALQVGKINSDALIANRASQTDAAKAGAQVYAQLAASAYSMINAQASVSGADHTNFNFAGSTTTSAMPGG